MKKYLKYAAIFGGLSMMLAACNGGSEEGSSSGGDDEVTLDFWFFTGEDDPNSENTINPVIDFFIEENPNINVNLRQLTWDNGLEQITTAFAGNSVPDVIELGDTWFANFVEEGVLANVSEQVQPIYDNHVNWDTVTYEDDVYGMPWLMSSRAMYINTDIFEEAGLDPNSPPQNWEEMLEYAKQIEENTDASGFGIHAGEPEATWHYFMATAWSNGADVLNEDNSASTINSPEMIEALEFYKEMSEYSLVSQSEVIDSEFRAGNIGMSFSGAWGVFSIPRDAPDLNFDVAPIPDGAQATASSFAGGEILVIPEGSENKEEAFMLMEHVASEEQAIDHMQRVGSMFAAVPGVEEHEFFDENPQLSVFAGQLESAKSSPAITEWQSISRHVVEAVERTLLNGVDPTESLNDAHEKIENEL
ncbi:extracellular solute-binding protein [Alkalihalobacillus sp. LMS6]|uniref:extracellular solute-binding protein n=1 Tax=Alkalihalobacillus sp. LMS6 TaxID=2924034 RepID=UPI0020D0B482|nr:extracellular solute-binding protein [Alkalihalobacillus sp. LMS6]UTR08140.1 extracellular solute-binding protein [Alkalihalobacillus sp. LMS6]